MKKTTIIHTVFTLLLLTGCLKGASSQDVKKVENINASQQTAYYNLEKGLLVDVADTAKVGWDISFQHTQIALQASVSGLLPGNTSFDKTDHLPATGYRFGENAIPNGSGKGWYLYNFESHSISPIPKKVILIRTASGKGVKLVIDSYYKTGTNGPAGYYSFRYAFITAVK